MAQLPFHQHQPPSPNHDVPDEFEPGSLPVQPDEGPPPSMIPEDPEHERVIELPSGGVVPGRRAGLADERP